MSDFDDWDGLGGPELRPVPRSRAKTTLAAAAVILAGVLLIGAGAWAIVRGTVSKPARPTRSLEPTSVTESFSTTGPASSEQSGGPATQTPATTSPNPAATPWVRAARVAYRFKGALWISDEAGAGARRVIGSLAGDFSLSPDGATIALASGSPTTLVLVDVATSRVTTVGGADPEAPVWAPSSAWLAYGVGRGTEVRRVDRDGRNRRVLGGGADPAIGPDAASYAFVTSAGRIAYSKAGAPPVLLTPRGPVDEPALSTDRVFYSVGATLPAGLSIHVMKLDGTGDRRIVRAPADPKAGLYDHLMLDGGGKWLVYTIAGDEKYSRMHAVRTDGTRDVNLSTRRDGYPLKWSADFAKIMFIDGNATQGESTQLMSIDPDGTSRLILVPGAGT